MNEIIKYFEENNLWDKENLIKHCQENGVYINESPNYPNIILLHYLDSVSFSRQWNYFNRICRGLIIDLKNKKVLAWPFNKFFNLGEMEETKINNIIKYKDMIVTEKLDGSMLILFKDPNSNRNVFTTKGSLSSEHGLFATSIMTENLLKLNTEKYTYMFELIHSKFRNVINYKRKGYKEGFYLIGIRDLETGLLLKTEELKELAKEINVPMFKIYDFSNIEEVINKTNHLGADEEGYVLRLNNEQLLVKIKGKEYLRAHKIIHNLNDKSILEVLIEKKEQYFLELCPEEYRDEIIEKINYFKKLKDEFVLNVKKEFEKTINSISNKTDRKEFALYINKNVEKRYLSFMFILFMNKQIDDSEVYKLFKKEIENLKEEKKQSGI